MSLLLLYPIALPILSLGMCVQFHWKAHKCPRDSSERNYWRNEAEIQLVVGITLALLELLMFAHVKYQATHP